MNISRSKRSALRAYFVKKAIPTEDQFAELIDGSINIQDDGIVRLPDKPLSIQADTSVDKNVLDFYRNFSDSAPEWKIGLNDAAKVGLNISDSGGTSRLFIDKATGNVGVGMTEPQARLHISGGTRIDGDLIISGKITLVEPEEPEWIPLPYNTDAWGQHYDEWLLDPAEEWPLPAYCKSFDGIVRLRGVLEGKKQTANRELIAQMPLGYQPLSMHRWAAPNTNFSGIVEGYPDGRIIARHGVFKGNFQSLDGVAYFAG